MGGLALARESAFACESMRAGMQPDMIRAAISYSRDVQPRAAAELRPRGGLARRVLASSPVNSQPVES